MMPRRTLAMATLAALLLQGCVAAAIPIAAGAALSQAGKGKGNKDVEQQPASAPAATTESDDPVAGARAVLLEGVTELPAPSFAGNTGTDETYTAFADYALTIAARDPLTDAVRPSALLAQPGSLRPEAAPCRFVGNAVLIDLDPADGLFDPGMPVTRTDLSAALARLRAQDIEVVWSTALTADRAGDVRRWLRETALDPEASDRLLMLLYPEDRKQTRRKEASAERCLIAILGDERADFDELFDYLKNADAALPLDVMLGKGWFLAPVSAAPMIKEGPRQ